jgi:PAS domain S-box-containing protein
VNEVGNSKTRVFLIEDNPGDARLIHEFLSKVEGAKFDVKHADCLSKGLRSLAQGGVDVILLDLSLPDSQGLDSLSKVLAQAPRVPIVVMSGLEDESVAIKAVQEGAQDYLVKGSMDAKLLARSLRYAIERQHLREALSESESRYRLLADNAGDVIWMTNTKWQITYVSPSVKRLFGYTVEEAMKLKMDDILTTDSTEQARKVIMDQVEIRTSTSQYPPLSLTLECLRKDGSALWVEAMLSFLWDEKGRLTEILGVTRDITARKKAEEALSQSEQQYAALVGNVTDGVFRFKEGKITWCNNQCGDMQGYAKEELIGADLDKLVPSDTRISDLYRTLEVRVEEQGHFQGIIRTKKKDGSVVDLEYSVSVIPGTDPTEFVGIVRDTTERRRTEEALQASERRYRLLAENMKDIILTTDMNLRITYVSPSLAQLTGYSVKETTAKNFEEALSPASFELLKKSFSERMEAEGSRQADLFGSLVLEVELCCKDDTTVPVEMRMNLLRDADGQPIGVLAVARDIGERRKAEEEKQRVEEQLRLAGRLAAVGELAAGVAHELNNPIAAIQGFAQLLTARNDLDETMKKDLSIIYREAQRAAKITQNLLSFARRHEPEKQLISLNEVIEETLEPRAHQMKVNNIELVVDFAADLPKTMADFFQMQQVFVNIINNAEQAMVEAHGKGRLVVKTQRAGDMIQISFADDGPGISEENIKRIFDPFFTTKEVGKGTGLGLSICYGLLEAHGGRIYVRSKLGEGATFVVEIPIISA